MPESVNGIGGIGDTLGMRHHNDTFTELMSGMPQKINHLSGGQRQRVAVGRALVAPGRAILADEPTGSLDPEMTDEVIDLLRHAAHQLGKCVIVVTHSKRVADSADAVYTLRHKKLAKA